MIKNHNSIIVFKNGNYYIFKDGVEFCKLNTHGNKFTTLEAAKIMCNSNIMLDALKGIVEAYDHNFDPTGKLRGAISDCEDAIELVNRGDHAI
jgi:hypothetical protein